MSLTVVTWNLKGSDGVDVAAVADHIKAVGADVAVLQEVQRRQAYGIAEGVGAVSLRWGFKHWPVKVAAEGMAIIGVDVPARATTQPLSCRYRWWSWRRRVFQTAEIDVDGHELLLVNVHLSPKRQAAMRQQEVDHVLAAIADGVAEGRRPLVAGDLNDRPAAAIFETFRATGLRDAWAERHPEASEAEAATNWRGWRKGTTDAPGQRLDYVLVPGGVTVDAMLLPRFGQAAFAPFASLSDHLPVTASLTVGPVPAEVT